MRLVHALLAVAIGTALAAGATAYAGSGEAAAQKQRIAIDMVVDEKTQMATFTVKPLTSGPIKSDKGTATLCCVVDGGRVLRNGMRTYNASIGARLDGRRGTLRLRQFIDQSEMQNGFWVSVGTWRIEKGTGTYSGIKKGGGRHVAVTTLPDRRRLVRQEGWVTLTG